MTKRSMPPPFHANLFALAAARYLTPLRQIRWAGLTVAHGVVV